MRVPVIEAAVERGATNPPGKSALHGEGHWKCVALAGLQIARLTHGASMHFIFAFAVLHDIMRENDDEDPKHGWRAAKLFHELSDEPGVQGFEPYGEAAMQLHYALAHHVDAKQNESDNVNVGICWDADRSTLWRVGTTPDPAYFSTEVGRSRATHEFGRLLVAKQFAGALPSWATILRTMEQTRFP